MGCRHSKSSATTTNNNDDVVLHNDTNNNHSKNIQHKDHTTTTNVTENIQQSNNESSKQKKKNTKKIFKKKKTTENDVNNNDTTTKHPNTNVSSLNHHHDSTIQMTSSTTTTTTATPPPDTTTTTNKTNPNHIKIRTSDRLYKVLYKLHQQIKVKRTTTTPTTSNGMIMKMLEDTYKLLVVQQPSSSQQVVYISTSNALYRHPTTLHTPLHLFIQLLEYHYYSNDEQQTDNDESHHPSMKTNDTTTTSKNNNSTMVSSSSNSISTWYVQIITELLRVDPTAIYTPDIYGNIPLHYIIMTPTNSSSSSTYNNNNSSSSNTPVVSPKQQPSSIALLPSTYSLRTNIIRLLLYGDTTTTSYDYISRNNVLYHHEHHVTYNSNSTKSGTSTASSKTSLKQKHGTTNEKTTTKMGYNCCSPLYYSIATIPDDDTLQYAPTLEYIHVIIKYMIQHSKNQMILQQLTKQLHQNTSTIQQQETNHSTDVVDTSKQQQILYEYSGTTIITMGNEYDGDKVLSLLYRRFTRQYDMAEQYFDGDNSRQEVIQHRQYYKYSANNTWKMIELLLKQQLQLLPISSSSNNNNTNPSVLNDTTLSKKLVTSYRTVHRAVQGETPPDLLRYIIETNANDVIKYDDLLYRNLPIHYAARYQHPYDYYYRNMNHTSTTTTNIKKSCYPSFYSKYVMDELLYKYPEGAMQYDSNQQYPLMIAIQSNKQWIGGGIQSLYDIYPNAVLQQQMSILQQQYPELYHVISTTIEQQEEDENEIIKEEKDDDNNIVVDPSTTTNNKTTTKIDQQQRKGRVDEQYDAIMLVQNDTADISEIVISMWSYEEDPGVQMLGCIAISRLLLLKSSSSIQDNGIVQQPLPPSNNDTDVPSDHTTHHSSMIDEDHCLCIALSAIPAVVNAMKAHPNEVIVQEKACQTLRYMASADKKREVSFVASGAIAAIIGAMQAHVSDPNVQEEACYAIQQILYYGGCDRATIVASVSGITAIMNAIAAHPNIRNVQYYGILALLELLQYHSTAHISSIPMSQIDIMVQQTKNIFPTDTSLNHVIDILLSKLV